jgi:hypothetical protein
MSGCHWHILTVMCVLVQLRVFVASGIYTGSVYVDEALLAIGMAGEGVTNKSVLAVKEHGFLVKGPLPFSDFDKVRERCEHHVCACCCMKRTMVCFDGQVVLLVRNPFDAMVAERKRRAHSHTGTPPWSSFVREFKSPKYVCSLFAVRCSLFAVRCSLFPVPCSLFAVGCRC